ncbi:MAG: type I-E CRISPR-associated protein Cas6/Cse3/CasE [Betaproteobacteria bacterium]|nr:type I-E CRISPR-associated protein Cas6/Cse3/CasE [Betaproteobacteria bacterium]
MFLSRVEIPWEAARNPYDVHRQLWRLFPGEEKETRLRSDDMRQGFLFRAEESGLGRTARLLVQSRQAPEIAQGLTILGTREIRPEPSAGQRLCFILTANPIKTIVDAERRDKPDKKSGKCRVPLIRDEDQREWLARKFAGAAEVEAVTVQPRPPLYFRKGGRGGKLACVTYEGVLRVTHSGNFISLLKNGIGHAKAFGCGLLLVRRL